MTTWTSRLSTRHLLSPSETVRSTCKSQLSQITQRYFHLFSFPLNTTRGKNLRIRGAVLNPNRMPLSTCMCVCVFQYKAGCVEQQSAPEESPRSPLPHQPAPPSACEWPGAILRRSAGNHTPAHVEDMLACVVSLMAIFNIGGTRFQKQCAVCILWGVWPYAWITKDLKDV